MKITFLFNMGGGWSIFKCMWQGEGGEEGLESIKLLTSFIQQMHERNSEMSGQNHQI